MKKFPVDAETTIQIGDQKGKTLEKHKGEQSDSQKMSTIKHTSDASVGTSAKTTAEKQPKFEKYTIKLSNANKKTNPVATEQTDNGDGGATTQKKHVSNFKWSGLKKVKDSLPPPTTKSTDMFLKIGDIKGEKEGIVAPPTSTKSSDMFLKIGDIKGEK